MMKKMISLIWESKMVEHILENREIVTRDWEERDSGRIMNGWSMDTKLLMLAFHSHSR
jgi:hypothetical protein